MSAVMRELRGEVDAAADELEARPVGFDDVVTWLTPNADRPVRVGLEIECGLVRPASGICITYAEPNGTRDLLTRLLDTLDGRPLEEGGALGGLILADGATLTLEMGGAIEYSGAPSSTLTQSLRRARDVVGVVSGVADELGIRLLSGGLMPFDDPQDIRWSPKPRTDIMRAHYRSLGEAGETGDCVMGLTLSVQLSLDSATEGEYFEKLHTLLLASPILSALLVATPSLRTGSQPLASQRMQYWRNIDPARCQGLTDRLLYIHSAEALAQTLLELPSIYRRVPQGFIAAENLSFSKLMKHGFHDGRRPTIDDWKAHVAQVWPSVRPRQTLETRLPDGQVWSRLGVIPALFLGLTANTDVRGRALEALKPLADGQDALTRAVAVHGYAALDSEAKSLARDLVQLADEGLRSLVAAGLEDSTALAELEPAREIAESGVTFSDYIAECWEGSWNRDPAQYVDAMAVPVG